MSKTPRSRGQQQPDLILGSGVAVFDKSLRFCHASQKFRNCFDLSADHLDGVALQDVIESDEFLSFLQHKVETACFDEDNSLKLLWDNPSPKLLQLRTFPCEGPRLSPSKAPCMMVLVDDLSAFEQVQSRIELAEKGFREIIEFVPDAIAIYRDGRFLYVNSAFTKQFGLSDDSEVLGRPIFDFVHPKEVPHLQKRIAEMFDGNTELPPQETILLRADGSEMLSETTGRMVILDGEPAIASVIRDLSKQREMTAHLMHYDRMIASSNLAMGVGHEINNPLTYVNTNIDFCLRSIAAVKDTLDDTPEPGTQLSTEELSATLTDLQDALEDAIHGAHRIGDIVKKLQAFSRELRKEETPTNLAALLRPSIDRIASQLPKSANLTIDIGDPRCEVIGSPSQLSHVFENLLQNGLLAIEDAPPGDHQLRVAIDANDEVVHVTITDTGLGIPPDILPQIFDPFFTTRDVDQGTGLGLYITQRVVIAHGGRVEVDTKPGEGTTFRIVLPRACGA